MLIYRNMFLKPFLYKKQQFKIYFVLIFLCVFSLILICNFSKCLNNRLSFINDNENNRMIVVSKMKTKDIEKNFAKLNEVEKSYKLYDSVTINSELGSLEMTFKQLNEHDNSIVKGNSIDKCSNCIVLPQYITVDNKLVDLSDKLGKKINLNYIDMNNDTYDVFAEIVGIYTSDDGKCIASKDIIEKFNISLKTYSYMLITKKVEYMDAVLEKVNDSSQAFVYNLNAYNQNKTFILFASVLKILFLFILISLLIIVSILINGIISDMKKEIGIMRAYGYSNLLIIININLIIFGIFLICFFVSIFLDYLLVKISALEKYLVFLSAFENIMIFNILMFIMLISSIISSFTLKKKPIYYLLKE